MQKIGVIGIGKLGLCFALNLERSGYKVYGVDIDPNYIDSLKTASFSSFEPQVNQLLAQAKHFYPTDNLGDLFAEDIEDLFVMVATPTDPSGGYDHTQVDRVANALMQMGVQKKERHLYIGCTTMPGYCDILAQQLAPYGYSVSYNPEFIAQGNIIHDQQYPDQVLIGEANQMAGDRLQAIYENMTLNKPIFCRMDRLSAEIAKLATNCFLTTKISFANAIGDLALTAGADPTKILAAVGADSRIGPKYLAYGFGFGGPCFPRDNRALGAFARSLNTPLHLSEATDRINEEHLTFQVEEYLKKYKENEPIHFAFITYKEDSILTVESQQLALAVRLAKAGRKVVISERAVVVEELEERFPGLFTLEVRE